MLGERLAGKQYSTDDTAKWTKEIALAVKQKLKGASPCFRLGQPPSAFFPFNLNSTPRILFR